MLINLSPTRNIRTHKPVHIGKRSPETVVFDLKYDTFTITNPIDPKVFFIRMNTYEKDKSWADKMVNFTYKVSNSIKKDEDFDKILEVVEEKVGLFNYSTFKGYGTRRDYDTRGYTVKKGTRGEEYYKRYLKKAKEYFKAMPTEEYKEADTVEFRLDEFSKDRLQIVQYTFNYNCKNLELIKKEYEKLKSIENPTVDEINKSCATIQWLFAQGFCYHHGSDSIANIFTKAIYHAYDIKITPYKKKLSADFEAFDTNLEDYIKKYPTFFEKPPEKISP